MRRTSFPASPPWVKAAVDTLDGLPDGPIVVPCCGTFPELDLLAPRFPGRQIVGIDISAEMVRLARERVEGRPQVEVVQGDAATLDRSYAAVVSVFGLQQLPDPVAAMRSWYDALRPGGRLTVVYWPEVSEESGPFALVAKVIGPGGDHARDDELIPALEGAAVERDQLVSFPMTHPDAATYFDSANRAGSMRALALARGDDYIAELRKRFLQQAPAGEWTHHPRARLISLRRQPSRAAVTRPPS